MECACDRMRLRWNERAPAGAEGVCAAAGARVFRPWPNPERESECGCGLIRARETIDTELINATLRGSYGYCNARAVRRNARSSQRKCFCLPCDQRVVFTNG